MKQRIRDAKRNFKPLQKISYDEWESIRTRSLSATKFFDDSNIVYRSMKDGLDEAMDIITENRLREVREEHTVSDTFKKVFITPKKIQDDELVGQIKFIKDLFRELQSWIDFKKEIEEQEADGSIVIERNKEKHG